MFVIILTTVRVSLTIINTTKSTVPSSTIKTTAFTAVSFKTTSVTPSKSTSTVIVSVTASQSFTSKINSAAASNSVKVHHQLNLHLCPCLTQTQFIILPKLILNYLFSVLTIQSNQVVQIYSI